MRNFNRGNKSGRGRDFSRPSMHKATCSECGNSCEVPFEPRGDKPVFCSSCFENQRGGNQNSRRSGGRDFGGRGFGLRLRGQDSRSDRDSGGPFMHKATCDQCGNECEVPFRPTKGKPVYCSDCFGDKDGKNKNYKTQRDSNKQLGAQFDILNAKLDKILNALASVVTNGSFKEKSTVGGKDSAKKPAFRGSASGGKKESKSKKAAKKTVAKNIKK